MAMISISARQLLSRYVHGTHLVGTHVLLLCLTHAICMVQGNESLDSYFKL